MSEGPWKCGSCGWVMPLGPGVEQTWCPCGWRKGDVVELHAKVPGQSRPESQNDPLLGEAA